MSTPPTPADALYRKILRELRATDEALALWAQARRPSLLAVIEAALQERAKGKSLIDRYSAAGAPKSGERGHKTRQSRVERGGYGVGQRGLTDLAGALIDNALALVQEPEVFQLWATAQGLDDSDDEERELAGADLADLLGTPEKGHTGRPLTPSERAGSAEFLIDLALAGQEGQLTFDLAEAFPRHIRSAGGGPLPRWLLVAILHDAMDRAPGLRIVNVPREVAAAFIRQHHSKLPTWPPRTMYAIGAELGSRLVAVATAGHPTGRWADQQQVLELTRVASDGTVKGAASSLVARILDLTARSGRRDPSAPVLFVTYSLTTEEGATYRALADKGLRPVEITHGKVSAGGHRSSLQALAADEKVRWEAGPQAGEARWDLLEQGSRPGQPGDARRPPR